MVMVMVMVMVMIMLLMVKTTIFVAMLITSQAIKT
jgi:hypothetical protein